LFGLLIAISSLLSRACAAEPINEVREFNVLVDDKQAGSYAMTYANRGTRTQILTNADIAIRVLIVSYRYRFDGNEVWDGGQLQQIVSRADDDGQALSLSADFAATKPRLIVNRQDRPLQPCQWTTTYAQLPAVECRDRELRVLVADTGEIKKVKLQRVGEEAWKTGRERLNCTRYRVSGELQADLWFDSADRLVRQKSIEDGHATELRLKSREQVRDPSKSARRE
jgi:hypothetical protein